MKSCFGISVSLWSLVSLASLLSPAAGAPSPRVLPSVQALANQLPCTVEYFDVAGCHAFLIRPKGTVPAATPWVWYAPVIGHPNPSHAWMLRQWLDKGIGMAGVDVGESCGNPRGRHVYSELWKTLHDRYGMAEKACLLPQSRGGLMLYNWAAENPQRVACIAGIYTVCDLRSYPGLERASGAYGLRSAELETRLKEHNPVDRLEPLAKARVPILHVHGNADTVVPLEKNAGELARRYRELGGPVRLIVVPGKGHQVCDEFFHCQELVDFVIQHARPVGRLCFSMTPSTMLTYDFLGIMLNHGLWGVMLKHNLLVSTALLEAGRTANWPRWRGPQDNGSSPDGDYPVKWSATANLLWKMPLPGKGTSTPIVWDGRIYLTAPVDGQDAAIALDAAGKSLWQTTLGTQRAGKHRNGSGCNPSPATDGRSLFVYFKSGTLAALDLDGKVRWKTNLQERFGKDSLYWDIGTSPVPTEKDVVVAIMHHGHSVLAAFDKQSGQLHWKVDRDYPTPEEGDHSYTTPIAIRHAGQEALLVWGALHLTAHDATTGTILWSCGGFNPQAKPNWVAVASPVIAGEIAVVPYGRGTCLHGIQLGGRGDVTATHRRWMREGTGSFVPTPAEAAGLVYLLRDSGEVECIAPASGATIWRGELPKKNAKYYASPTVAGGLLYAAREDGVVFVVRARRDGRGSFEILAENDMGERLVASPVPASNRLLLRGERHLFCIGKE